nr:site-2 protease family protein [Sedimentibacter sp.]
MSYILNKLIILPGILLAISIHEFSHGFVAVKLGDDTPRIQGRMTLNPLKHIDPLGFLCLLLVGFGWAKPVIIDPRNFKNPRKDDLLVSIAGPISNFIMAFIFVVIMKLIDMFLPVTDMTQVIWSVLAGTVQINLVLMVFNLLPIPPLDGHHIMGDIGGAPVWNFYYKYHEQLRFAILFLVIFNIMGKVIGPIVLFLYRFLFSIFF